jgi:hypothetical protein
MDRVRSHHTGEEWRRQLANIYRLVEGCKHNPKPIPVAGYSRSNAEVALSAWHTFLNGDVNSAAEYAKTVRELAFDVAFQARERGNYRVAFKIIWQYLYTYGFDRGILVAAAKPPLHRVYQRLMHREIVETT